VVATLLRIRFRVLGNTLARNPLQLVGFLFGAFGALWALAGAGIGLFFAGTAGVDVARAAIIVAGAVVTLGWIVGPIFIAGVDTTLDPAKLAPFPMSTRRMMVAITAAGATGIPGIACAVGALLTFLVWWRWPIAAGGAIVAIPLGFVIWVVASYTVATLAGGLGGNRRTREAIALIAFAVLIFASPIVLGILSLVRAAADAGAQIVGIVDAVSWTPIAAAWAVPGDLAAGSPLTALAKFAIALATLALLWVLWNRSLSASLVSSPTRSSARRVGAGKLGWFGVMPASALGATWARSLTTWLRDLRYLRQLLFVPFVPVIVLLYTGWDLTHGVFAMSGLLVAFFVGILAYTDVSYDGTAFGTVLQTGISGRADRLGRMLGAATLGVPVTLVVDIVIAAISGAWHLLPGVLGASIALLFIGYGVSAISSALLIIPTPAPGDNPFKRVPGASFSMFLIFFGCWVATAVLAAPAVVPAVLAAVTGAALPGWIALAVGVVLGPVLFAVGVSVGGRIFDRTAPSLFFQLKSFAGT
jgi:ABC-2 type transport system permease protein